MVDGLGSLIGYVLKVVAQLQVRILLHHPTGYHKCIRTDHLLALEVIAGGWILNSVELARAGYRQLHERCWYCGEVPYVVVLLDE